MINIKQFLNNDRTAQNFRLAVLVLLVFFCLAAGVHTPGSGDELLNYFPTIRLFADSFPAAPLPYNDYPHSFAWFYLLGALTALFRKAGFDITLIGFRTINLVMACFSWWALTKARPSGKRASVASCLVVASVLMGPHMLLAVFQLRPYFLSLAFAAPAINYMRAYIEGARDPHNIFRELIIVSLALISVLLYSAMLSVFIIFISIFAISFLHDLKLLQRRVFVVTFTAVVSELLIVSLTFTPAIAHFPVLIVPLILLCLYLISCLSDPGLPRRYVFAITFMPVAGLILFAAMQSMKLTPEFLGEYLSIRLIKSINPASLISPLLFIGSYLIPFGLLLTHKKRFIVLTAITTCAITGFAASRFLIFPVDSSITDKYTGIVSIIAFRLTHGEAGALMLLQGLLVSLGVWVIWVLNFSSQKSLKIAGLSLVGITVLMAVRTGIGQFERQYICMLAPWMLVFVSAWVGLDDPPVSSWQRRAIIFWALLMLSLGMAHVALRGY